jgi:ubiquinone/menaquinone biosynthesis C-methylase UbiE
MNTEDSYLMESETEGRRIFEKTDLEATRSQLILAGLRQGMNCLDVGCASGAATIELAALCAPGKVTGMDISQSHLSQAEKAANNKGTNNAIFMCGNVYSLPFEDNRFDFVWVRFLLEYLKEPLVAISEAKRVARPGGLVVCADLDGNCLFHYPISPRLDAGLNKVMAKLSETGFDPWVGRKLYHYYRVVGFSQISAQVFIHHLIAGEPCARERNNWHAKIDTLHTKLSDSFSNREESEYLLKGMKTLIDSPDTFTYSPLIMMIGTK